MPPPSGPGPRAGVPGGASCWSTGDVDPVDSPGSLHGRAEAVTAAGAYLNRVELWSKLQSAQVEVGGPGANSGERSEGSRPVFLLDVG